MTHEIEPPDMKIVQYTLPTETHPNGEHSKTVTLQTVLDTTGPGMYGDILKGLVVSSYNLAMEAGNSENVAVQYAADYLAAKLLKEQVPELPTPKTAHV